MSESNTNQPLKLTMQTPDRTITVALPAWIERRIFQLFISQAKKEDTATLLSQQRTRKGKGTDVK